MITQKMLEQLATKAGYQEARDYAEDKELVRCEVCRKWGKWGDEVIGNGVDNYCEADRPADDEVQS